MIPLSRSVRKSCEDPFFNPGTLSRISSKSLSTIKCLWSRARKTTTHFRNEWVYYLCMIYIKYIFSK